MKEEDVEIIYDASTGKHTITNDAILEYDID